MDIRNYKTEQQIIASFRKLVINLSFDEFVVQDILNDAQIGRATFYAHFESKEQLLASILDEMFEHIFHHEGKEEHHDFSKYDDLNHILVHLFYHIKEDGAFINKILLSHGKNIFIERLEINLNILLEKYLYSLYENQDVPNAILNNHLLTSLEELIIYWVIKDNFKTTPEAMTRYYNNLVLPILDLK